MEGVYKTKLSERQLRDTVRETLGGSMRDFREFTQGWANSAYGIQLDDGRQVVLKARPPATTGFMRCEVDLMRTEVQAMKQLSEADPTFPIPRIYVYDDSLDLLPVEYFVMEQIDGTPYNQVKTELSEENRQAIEFRLGELNRRINALRGERFGFYGNAAHDHWRDAFAEMIFGVLEDGKEAEVALPIPYADVERAIASRLDALNEVTEPRLLHWDLWDGNVFVKDGAVTGIIDFERAVWGDPLMEHYFSHFNKSPFFRQGYGLFPTEPSQLARVKLYDLYLDLLLHIECAYRKYEDEGHIKWAYDNLAEGLKRFK